MSGITCWFAISLAFISAANGSPAYTGPAVDAAPYIIGGRDISIYSHPHQVSLQHIGGQHRCGGSIIGQNKVLTAAHCTQEPASHFSIRAGTSLRTSGGQLLKVHKISNHPKYCGSCSDLPNDISVVMVSPSFVYGAAVQAIQLSSADHAGQMCSITGWGKTTHLGPLSDHLQGLDIKVISNPDCNVILDPIPGITITSGQVCVFDRSAKTGSCSGDSGSPVTCNSHLVGVISWVISTRQICRQDYPTVCSRVSHYRDWILSQ